MQAAGRRWCDEADAIAIRRSGRTEAAWERQQQLDQAPAVPALAPGAPDPQALLSFVAQNARAATGRLLGDLDMALRYQYEADDAALRCGLPGPRIVSLSNLGALNQELFNLDDAQRFTEDALAEARSIGSPLMLGAAAANLIVICHAAGEAHRMRDMLQLLVSADPHLPPGAQDRFALQLALAHLDIGEHEAALARIEAAPPGDGAPHTRETSYRLFWHWLHARCRLAFGDATTAAARAEAELATHDETVWRAHPYLAMELLRATADAHEHRGQPSLALARTRQAHALYEMLVGRGARARFVALDVAWRLKTAQQERDVALRLQQMAEAERSRLQSLNDALQAQVLETQRLHEQLREQALRDPLTGLHNRRFLFEAVPGLFHRARRDGSPVTVAMLDLDHFKRLNDEHGHAAGDAVLQRFAALLRQHLRAGDLVCRHGGEEFVVVLAGAADPQVLLRRLLDDWGSLALQHDGRPLPPLGFSAGMARLDRDGDSLEPLLRAADAALYRAKAAGRARIEAASS